ncbi:hypothetical protein NCAS_0A14180 [Naumovozyma castellii]|uniref:Uncharacterized protein n=1 Tax=Naumovozyma castellii TaxID=27288 RepID=G0V926_NAUCA|nr:hypothetical protein NCAS_0A14180 [Naumovozyma castellii CBS 4309]CCC67976.1 hypothetical protein NCAS_0A14180 [Naumovozyma castellii CBS 4309]
MSRAYLSASMRESETSLAYSLNEGYFNHSYKSPSVFCVSSSHSQGFAWNQDLFASQHQQLCKVIYDGHVDNMTNLIATIRDYIPNKRKPNRYRDTLYDEDESEDEEEESDYYYYLMNRSRRKSEHSISFKSDSKTGKYQKNETTYVEVESNTPENEHLRWLLS